MAEDPSTAPVDATRQHQAKWQSVKDEVAAKNLKAHQEARKKRIIEEDRKRAQRHAADL